MRHLRILARTPRVVAAGNGGAQVFLDRYAVDAVPHQEARPVHLPPRAGLLCQMLRRGLAHERHT